MRVSPCFVAMNSWSRAQTRSPMYTLRPFESVNRYADGCSPNLRITVPSLHDVLDNDEANEPPRRHPVVCCWVVHCSARLTHHRLHHVPAGVVPEPEPHLSPPSLWLLS